jgi:hypothetical protein
VAPEAELKANILSGNSLWERIQTYFAEKPANSGLYSRPEICRGTEGSNPPLSAPESSVSPQVNFCIRGRGCSVINGKRVGFSKYIFLFPAFPDFGNDNLCSSFSCFSSF